MKIALSSVMVNHQDKAKKFYTEVLGFVEKRDIPISGSLRWLTVVSPDDTHGPELVLEPTADPASQAFQKATYESGKPMMAFAVNDIDQEFDRLTKLGVKFSQPPIAMGPIKRAVLDDTCGNYIQLFQVL
ncbi:MAG: VOC family protein [Deinococcales bacterium]